MTVRDLINGSLRLLGVLAEGEAANASQAQDALDALNGMMDSWNTENLSVMGTVQYIVTLVNSQQTYTMGTGGDIDIPRPSQISDVSAVYPSGPQSVFLPLDEFSQQQYAQIAVIGYQTPIPQAYFINYNFPLNELNVFPMPQAGTQLRFWASGAIPAFSDVSLSIALAPGYERAIRYCLALELAPEYGAAAIQAAALVQETANTAKSNVQRLNAPDLTLNTDLVLGFRRGTFNRITGDVY